MAVKEVAEQCEEAQQKITDSVPDIVEKVIEKAKDGSVPHAKFLMDWADVKPEKANAKREKVAEKTPEETESGKPSLAESLLKALREILEEGKQAKAAADSISVP